MTYCTKCGAENPDQGIYCMECGERLVQVSGGGTQPAPISHTYQQSYPPVAPDNGVSTPVIQPVREKYGHIIFHSSYNILVVGALVFGLSPLIGIGMNLLFMFVGFESEVYSLLASLIDPICFGIFIYGIYLISQAEPSSVNTQLRSVPLFLIIYVVGTFITGFVFEGIEATSMDTLEELREVAMQGIIFVVTELGFSVLLVMSALKFSAWFEEFVTMLGAPYNGPTARFKWFSFLTLANWGILAITYLMLLTAIDTLSASTIDTAFLALGVAAIVIFAVMIMQILSGYKIYSTLNNIRQGKYDGTYQAQVKQKYQY